MCPPCAHRVLFRAQLHATDNLLAISGELKRAKLLNDDSGVQALAVQHRSRDAESRSKCAPRGRVKPNAPPDPRAPFDRLRRMHSEMQQALHERSSMSGGGAPLSPPCHSCRDELASRPIFHNPGWRRATMLSRAPETRRR